MASSSSYKPSTTTSLAASTSAIQTLRAASTPAPNYEALKRGSRPWEPVFRRLAMKRIVCLALMLTSIIVCAALGQQQNSSPAPGVIVPRLIRFGGALRTVGSEALSRTVGVTFALYREQEGGAPLWLETQN